MFARRADFSSFNVLPRHKINSYHIKVGADLVQFIHVVLFAHSPVCFSGLFHALMVMTLMVMQSVVTFVSSEAWSDTRQTYWLPRSSVLH